FIGIFQKPALLLRGISLQGGGQREKYDAQCWGGSADGDSHEPVRGIIEKLYLVDVYNLK
ncbi:hypothetical protein, partial [Pseudomonas reactans]|uniref:hypothetical protein n=1 Tax=Pseudomonas reactans TaxID=117680 RepID=UPI001C432BF2